MYISKNGRAWLNSFTCCQLVVCGVLSKFCVKKEKTGKKHPRLQGRLIMDVQPLSCPITDAFKLTAEMIPDLGRKIKKKLPLQSRMSEISVTKPVILLPHRPCLALCCYQVEFQRIHPEKTGFSGQGRGPARPVNSRNCWITKLASHCHHHPSKPQMFFMLRLFIHHLVA